MRPWHMTAATIATQNHNQFIHLVFSLLCVCVCVYVCECVCTTRVYVCRALLRMSMVKIVVVEARDTQTLLSARPASPPTATTTPPTTRSHAHADAAACRSTPAVIQAERTQRCIRRQTHTRTIICRCVYKHLNKTHTGLKTH